MNKATFYIDGFNFYYGIKRSMIADKRWGNAYWIDIVKLCSSFLAPNETLKKVVYFTASPLSPAKNTRQSAFLNANKLINKDKFEIIRGKYLEKHFPCPYCNGDISKPEEKKTDVNISVRMIKDCIDDLTDSIILVSADTDLIPPLELIRSKYPNKRLKVIFPPSNYSNDIVKTLQSWKLKVTLMKNNYQRFKNAIMNDIVKNDIESYSIPNEWKQKQAFF